jgi:hypothetical protein
MILNFRNFDIQEPSLTEGLWSDAKYQLAKLGSITKGGKFFGRGKQAEKAQKEYDEMLKDVRNSLIKDLDVAIKKETPKFPNNKEREEFLTALSNISAAYDSVVQSCLRTYGAPKYPNQKDGTLLPVLKPEDKGYMDIGMANSLIKSLRMYVQKLIDYDLSTSYTVFESCNLSPENLKYIKGLSVESLNEEISLNPLNWFKKKPKEAQGPALSGGKETATKKEVESSKKELIIGGIGAALGVFGWVAQTDWFKDLLEGWLNKPAELGTKVVTEIKEVGYEVKSGDGFTQTINKICGTNLGPNTTTDQFIETMKERGFGSIPNEIVKNLGMSSLSPNPSFVGDASAALSNKGELLKSVFSGITSGKAGSLLALKPGPFIATQISSKVVTFIAKKAVTTGTVLAVKFAGAGAFAVKTGGVLIAGALTSWLLKRKAKSSSRYKDLQELLERLYDLKIVEGRIYYENDEVVKYIPSEEGTGEGGEETEKSMYPLMISNLKSLQSLISTSDGISLEGDRLTITKKKEDEGIKPPNKPTPGKSREERVKEKYKQLILSWKKSQKAGGKNTDPGEGTRKRIMKEAEGSVKESRFLNFGEFGLVLEEKTFGKSRNVEVTKVEDYLSQAVNNIKKSVKFIKDEKDKGVGITYDFIGEILKEKMTPEAKEAIKKLYEGIYSYLYGANSKTLSDLGPLYKESVQVISNKSKRQVASEKIARLAKRSLQFEGENMYGGLGEFGADLKDFNTSLKKIMDHFKSKS